MAVTSTSIAPSITGAATATAFTTTYGTASSPQTFSVSGSNLTADLVATAPAGFEVSSDGTIYGSTATFTQSGGSASGTLRVRLTATAGVSGSYNSQNIVLSSTGASSVNITTASSGNAVSTKGLTITGLSAADKNWDGTTTASVTGTPAYSGLVNGESFAVTGSVTWAFPDANVGANKTLTRTGSYDAPSANYTVTQPTLTASINAVAPSAPTITGITPGDAQLSVAFTAPASNGGASITNYEYSTNGGSSWTTPDPVVTTSPLLITGLVNGATYDVQLRAVNSAGSGAATSSTAGTPEAPASPTITVLPVMLSGAMSTTYGTASSTQSFTVVGATLSGNLTITAPAGLVVSTNSATGFASSLNLTATSGSVSSTTIYVRLPATAAAGTYNSQNITVSGGGATTQNVTTTSSGNTVSQAPLTITGISIANKVYDGNTTATISGTAAYSGLQNGETFSVAGTPGATFATKTVANAKSVTVSGYEAPSANYSITQPAGLTANITAKELTVSDAVAANKVYDATTSATITGTLSGVVSGDTVTLSGTGTFASADVGTGIVVTSTSTLGGADAGNYTLTQPTGLTANITQATQTITFGALSNVTAGTTNALTATASSGLAVSYTSANTNVATIANLTNVVAVAPGVTTITASQAGNSNVAAATPVSQTLNVAAAGGGGGSFTNTLSTINNGTNVTTKTFTPVFDPASPSYATQTGSFTQVGGLGHGTADNAAYANFTGWDDTTRYFYYAITAAAGYDLTVTAINSNIRSSNTGPRAVAIETATSLAGTWTQRAISNLTNANDTAVNATGLSISVPAGTTLYIRYRNTGTTSSNGGTVSSTGTFRLNSGSIVGSYASTAAGGPTITPSGSFLAVSTTYGTASAASASTAIVTGGSLSNDITATAPNGFQVSTNGSVWTNAVTYAQSNGFADGTLYLRLNSNALAGTYSNQVVTLTSGGASNQTVAISNSTVSRYPITVGAVATNKVYGAADPALTYTNAALLFSDTFSGSISRTAGSNAGTYTIEQGTLTNANYDITFLTNAFTITPKALTITADNVTKAFGVELATPQTGSTAFTSSGLVSGDSISSVTITYTDGAGSGAAPGTYTGAVVPSAPVGIDTNNYSITYNAGDLTVDAAPTITVGTSSLPAFTTTYGTDSSTQTFTVTGGNLTGDVTVTAPAGFQVSTNASAGFGSSLELTAVANAVAGMIYVRVPGTANASTNLSGNIDLTSAGATTRNVSIAASTVSPKALTIGGLSASNRVYDATTNGAVSGTPVYVGLTNSQSFEVTNSISWFFANKNVGTNKVLSASTNFTAPSANYTISSQPAFSADITPATLTLSGAAATSRAYAAGNTNVTITGTLSGVLGSDTVGFTGTGNIASANAGTNIPVTANVTLTGADAGNYTLTQPTGLTVDITKATNTITFGALSNVTVGTTNALTATASSGLAVTYTSANTNVATISGSNVIAVAPGVTTITASQAGDGNFDAATPVTQTLNVAGASAASGLVAGWDFTTTTNGGTASAASPNTPKQFTANFGSGTIFLNGTNGSSSWSTSELDAFGGTTANALTNWSTSTATGTSLSLVAGTTNAITANDKSLVFAFSMSGRRDLAVSYATRGTASGFTTHTWSYSADGTNWTVFDTEVGRTNTSYATLTLSNLTNLNNVGTAFLRMTVSGATGGTGNNRLDNIQFNATASASPGITASGSFLAVSTTYGTASAASASTATVTGGSLSADITATAPTGFQVSTNGSLWTNAVSFAQSNGFADGLLYLRLASDASAGTYSNQTVSLTSGSASNSIAIATSTVASVSLPGGDITLSPVGDGSYTASGPAGSTFNLNYSGRTANGITTSYSSATAPTAAGYYTVTATATGNYTGSNNASYFIAGPVAFADTVQKIAAEDAIVIEAASLLANDRRIDSLGAVQTNGLTLSLATSGANNEAQVDGSDVLFLTTGGSAPWTFTYTITDATTRTAVATVTVNNDAVEQPFTLQIVAVGSATFDGSNTAVTHSFLGVPNQTYLIEYSTDLATWTSAGNQSSGASGSFAVTITRAGNFASAWNNAMFFRATRVNP